MPFEVTENWTAYGTKEADIVLPAGASYITFATVGGNDGPNLDQLELLLVKAYALDTGATDSIVAKDSSAAAINPLHSPVNTQPVKMRLFGLTGQLLRESSHGPVNTSGLPSGTYLLQVRIGSTLTQKTIRVK